MLLAIDRMKNQYNYYCSTSSYGALHTLGDNNLLLWLKWIASCPEFLHHALPQMITFIEM